MDLNGLSRPFDAQANGFVRAETVCAVFLQRSNDAKRIYAKLIHTKTSNDGAKPEGMFYPSKHVQKKLLEEFYDEIKIDPNEIGFVEAHATGTIAGDPQEAWAIDKVFCKNRESALPIGSIKSNMGHAESASAMASLAKVILTLENRKIPPNINFAAPRSEIKGLIEGRMRVVTETEDLKGQLVAINSFGILGANAHLLLKGNEKNEINCGVPSDDLPRLVLWAGRTAEAVNSIFDDIVQRPLNGEFIALLQGTQTKTSASHYHRGYGVFKHDSATGRAVCIASDIRDSNEVKRPIVWVFSGVGSHWPGMCRDMMQIPIFAAAVEKCHDALKPSDFDLKKVLASDDKIFDDVVNTFVGIAAVQIGLTDILKAIGLTPDFIVGHSVGELGCAYADGTVTSDEMIRCAHARGMACKEAKVLSGKMAAVGMELGELKKLLPRDIDIACHNSSTLYTVSGPADSIELFVRELSQKKIFARLVASSMPFHSRYIADAGPLLHKKLTKIIEKPEKRSPKWISSSASPSDWPRDESKFSSADYHTNNLLQPVLFAEACRHLPSNSICVEVAPHSLLKAVLKRSVDNAIHVGLMQRSKENGTLGLMEALGS